MNIIFEPEHYPRTMSRMEWIRAYRWVRRTRKELQSQQERLVAATLLSGDEHLRKEVFDKLLYPPIMMVPSIDMPVPIDLRPGAINYIRKPRKSYLP